MTIQNESVQDVRNTLAELGMPSDEETAKAVAKVLFDVRRVIAPLRQPDLAEFVPAMMGNHSICASRQRSPKN